MDMKKTNKMLVLAAFFAGGLVLTACSDLDDSVSEEVIEQGGVVKAEFTISFPQQMGSGTRQGLDIVQGQTTPVFRGIQNIELRPFSVVPGSVSISTTAPTPITLGAVAPTDGTGWSLTNAVMTTLKPTAENQVSKSHLYQNIEVPVGTRSFMFYGVAIPSTSVPTGVAASAVNGSLTRPDGDPSTLADITFSPTPIYGVSTVEQEGGEIAQYLTAIAKAGYGDETTLTLFPNFTDINTGSWNSVKAVVQQVYSHVYDKVDFDGTTPKNLQAAIVEAITKEYNFSTTSVTRKYKFAEEKLEGSAKTGELTFNTTLSYPQNINLPDGAAYVKWNAPSHPNVFTALTTDNMGQNIATLDYYAYPAALYYYGLSDIKTAGVTMEGVYKDNQDNINNNGTSGKTWKDILDEYDKNEVVGKGTVVQSTTKSIALVKEVQYAVGRLDVTVRTSSGNAWLTDNENQTITIEAGTTAEATTFPITGIIIANQRPVGYNFEPCSTTQYAIYDTQVTDGIPCLYPGTTYPEAKKTHTLVLQTLDVKKDNTSNNEEDDYTIRIAVEFMNNSNKTIVGRKDDTGKSMLIYPGTKFYLIGKLDPSINTDKYYNGSTTELIKKAFVQDYYTTANFLVEDFKKAYNMLPDMRKPKLEIGMSVDLTWNKGIEQNVEIE